MAANEFLSIVQKVTHAYKHMCDPLLSEFDIPQVSFDILMFLHNNPEYCTAREICEIRYIKKNLVSVHVEKLAEQGLIERSDFAGDRRKRTLRCTEKSMPIIEAGLKMQASFFEAIGEGIDKEKWIIFTEIHNRISSNAEKLAKN